MILFEQTYLLLVRQVCRNEVCAIGCRWWHSNIPFNIYIFKTIFPRPSESPRECWKSVWKQYSTVPANAVRVLDGGISTADVCGLKERDFQTQKCKTLKSLVLIPERRLYMLQTVTVQRFFTICIHIQIYFMLVPYVFRSIGTAANNAQDERILRQSSSVAKLVHYGHYPTVPLYSF